MEKECDDGVVVVDDPLFNYWGLSLFPQTSSVFPSNPNNLHHDLHSIHNHLRSMALTSPNKLLDEAKSIVDANPELFNSQISSVPASDETNDVVVEESQDQEFPRKRRPALGLKRGHFSLKPTKKPSVENLLPSLDLNKLKDPVEFFLAHERLENAKKEIQKQMGSVSFESNEDKISTKPRQRRPELPGNNQRPVKYRHRYPRETFDNNDYVPSSQEAIGSDGLEPVGENADKGGACLTSLENEVTDYSATEENKINNILDELLHCNPEDLEGDEAMTLLQERLQIKPIVLEKLSVPDFPDNQMIDLKSMRGNLSKPRKALANIDNLLKGMNNKTPLKQDVANPVQQLASPTPPRSPFAPLLSLQMHISRSKPSADPFSAHEIDHSSARNYSPAHMIYQELDLVSSEKPSNEMDTLMFEDTISVSKTSPFVDTVKNCTSTSGKSKEDNSGKSPDEVIAPVIEDTIVISGRTSVEDTVRNCAGTSQKPMEDNSREPEFYANVGSNESHVDMDMDIGGSGMSKRAVSNTEGGPNSDANGTYEFEGMKEAENMQADAASVPTDGLNFNLVNPLDQSKPAEFQASATDTGTRRSDDGPEQGTRRSDDGPEQCLQVEEKTDGSLVPDNRQRRAELRSQKQSKCKRLSQRQSLAAAGTSWKSGVRRSTRIRTRPLEYWKGERMVYGRVHESLATVIGVKCMSPGSDGKPTMKVKSYVSDKYKELFELASLY